MKVNATKAISGLVKTHFLQNLHTTPALPETSVYRPAKAIINPWMSGKRADDAALDVEAYAEGFVRNALSKRPKARYWSAVNSTSVWAVERLLGGGTVWVSCNLLCYSYLSFSACATLYDILGMVRRRNANLSLGRMRFSSGDWDLGL